MVDQNVPPPQTVLVNYEHVQAHFIQVDQRVCPLLPTEFYKLHIWNSWFGFIYLFLFPFILFLSDREMYAEGGRLDALCQNLFNAQNIA